MMEAKDTVMNEEQVWAVISKCKGTATEARHDVNKAQAEISFNIGETHGFEVGIAQGRREVVDFIHEEFGGYTKAVMDGGELVNILIDNNYGEDGSLDKWQAKLKEWGIKVE